MSLGVGRRKDQKLQFHAHTIIHPASFPPQEQCSQQGKPLLQLQDLNGSSVQQRGHRRALPMVTTSRADPPPLETRLRQHPHNTASPGSVTAASNSGHAIYHLAPKCKDYSSPVCCRIGQDFLQCTRRALQKPAFGSRACIKPHRDLFCMCPQEP